MFQNDAEEIALMQLKEKNIPVESIMTQKVVTIEGQKTILEACHHYRNHRIGCLIVTNKNTPLGIITERDIIERVIIQGKNPKTTLVEDIMSTDLKMIPSSATVEFAAQTMMKHKIKKLPVVSENKMVGIVTVTDITRIAQDLSKIIICEGYPFSSKTIHNLKR
jgi:CBS domain-containing protein